MSSQQSRLTRTGCKHLSRQAAWNGSCATDDGGACSALPSWPDASCVPQELLLSVGLLAANMAYTAAAALAATISELDKESFPLACMRAANELVLNHLDMLFGQHLAPLVACCVYGVAKCLDVAVSFKVC